MHHGNRPDPEMTKHIVDSMRAKAEATFRDALKAEGNGPSPALGATGRFPMGKLTEKDEGEIQFAVTTKDGRVVISFGDYPVTWVGMTPQQANELADLLKLGARGID